MTRLRDLDYEPPPPYSKTRRRALRRRLASIVFPLDFASTRRARHVIEKDVPALLAAYEGLEEDYALELEGAIDEANDGRDIDRILFNARIDLLSARVDQLSREARGEPEGRHCCEIVTDDITRGKPCYPEHGLRHLCGRIDGHDAQHACNRCGLQWSAAPA